MSDHDYPSGEIVYPNARDYTLWQDMHAWRIIFGAREPTKGESGFTSLVELEKLWDENLILAELHNSIIDLIKHRKCSIFRHVLVGRIIEFNFNTLPDYNVFSGGFYLLEKGRKETILSVVS